MPMLTRRMFLHVIANQCAHWCGNPFSLQQHRTKSSAYGEYETACAFTPVPPSCTRAHLPTFCMSLRGAKRRGNPLLLRQHEMKSNTLGEYEKHCEFAPMAANFPGISAGKRIAAPVCALARNDMQKTGSCQRLQGRFPAVPWQRPLANADTWQISACHCEERSDVAIRSPAAAQTEKQSFGRIRKALRICPNGSKLSRYFCGETDCRTSVRTGSQ